MVLRPCAPENCGVLNTVITESSCIRMPSPLLKLFNCDAASRSRPALEFTETPATGLPDELMVPPNDTRCAPDTTVRPTEKLLVALMTLDESLMNALALVAIWMPSALPLAVTVAFDSVNELPLTLMPKTWLA